MNDQSLFSLYNPPHPYKVTPSFYWKAVESLYRTSVGAFDNDVRQGTVCGTMVPAHGGCVIVFPLSQQKNVEPAGRYTFWA